MFPAVVSAPSISYPDLDSLILIEGNSLLASGIPFISQNFASYGVFSGQDDIEYLFAKKDPLLRELAFCESSLNPQAIGKRGEIGLFQYLPKTWQWFNSIRGTNLDIYNPSHQIEMTEWALKRGLQKHWTCWGKVDI